MPGRYTLFHTLEEIAEKFNVKLPDFDFQPRYNATPSQLLPVIIIERGERVMKMMRWGLIPPWAESVAIGNKMINARSETLAEKPSFRNALKSRRCLIPVDGYYEWLVTEKGKQPLLISLKSKETFAFAGLWEIWKSPVGDVIYSFTAITTEPNEFIARIHHRMGAILTANQDDWLSDKLILKQHLDILKPYPSEEMTARPVSKMLKDVRLDVPELLDEKFMGRTDAQPKEMGTLF
ncbi:MAG: SOS response-associated peptidase [Ignavibacteriae bacterium]|nr:SOS response-associated peptidase [Ignavibacteriota bacterium]